MKIYSWNMLFLNKELDHAFAFVTHSDFDIFCLQEVPKIFFERLKTLSYRLVSRVDIELDTSNKTRETFDVILSKHPLEKKADTTFPNYWTLLPLRTRLFVQIMQPFGFTRYYSRGFLSADADIGGTSVRIINLHTTLAQPTWRLKEFEMAMAERDATRPTIVCGDFNTLEKPHITPLNWLLGGRVSDALLYKRERTHIEKRFVEYELTNALRGKMTHFLSRSQLDHILVSHSFSIKNAEIIPDRIGSDHHPIRVEID